MTSAPTKGLTAKYALALGLVAVTSLTAFVLLSALIEGQRGSAVEINISGRQRMLSQRTALFALSLASAESEEERAQKKAILLKLVNLFSSSNEGLVHGNAKLGLPGNPTPPLKALYFGQTDLYRRVKTYAKTLTALANAPDLTPKSPELQSILGLAPGLLVDLNRAVKAYEAQATERVDFLHHAEGALVIFTLLLLLAEALVIFRPLVRQIHQHVDKIHAQALDLTKRERSLRLVLDNTGDGIVTVNADGSLRDIRSAVVSRWFKDDEPVWSGLFPDDETKQSELALAFEDIGDEIMPFEVIVDQMPRHVVRDGRSFELDLRKVAGSDEEWLLLLVRDITAKLAQAKAEAANRELVGIVQTVSKDRKGFMDFMQEMDRLLTMVTAPGLPMEELLRGVHTLKGNAAIFGFASFAETCHELESRLVVSDEVPMDEVVQLEPAWRESLERIEAFVSQANSADILEIERTDYYTLVQGIRTEMSKADLLTMLRQWRHIPTKRRLQRIGMQIERVSQDTGKPINVEIVDHQSRIPENFLKEFWPTLVHVVRNAVDHGIEAPEERLAAGKPEAGLVTVSARLADDFVVTISDDGRGIDWKKVQSKARAQGLPAQSDQDLAEALFVSGLSTREEVTELSGRGVGMAEVRQQCERAGGRIDIQSRQGQGASFTFRFPAPPAGFTQDLGRPS